MKFVAGYYARGPAFTPRNNTFIITYMHVHIVIDNYCKISMSTIAKIKSIIHEYNHYYKLLNNYADNKYNYTLYIFKSQC